MTTTTLTRGRTLDHVAGIYDILSPLMLFGQEGRLSRPCVRYLQNQRIRSVLDIGCGTGTLSIEIGRILAKRGGWVNGIDAAPKMIDVASRKASAIANVLFDVAAAESLPFPDGRFDHALSTFFFHHID